MTDTKSDTALGKEKLLLSLHQYEDAYDAWEFRESMVEKAVDNLNASRKAYKKALRQYRWLLVREWFRNAYQNLLGFTSRK